MVAMRYTRSASAAVVATALVIGAAGCSGSDDHKDLTMVIDADGWTAAGGSVDAGLVCPGGLHHHVGYLELDGSPLAPAEGFERMVDAIWADPPDIVATHLRVDELTCDDGSGSFTMVGETRNGGPWSVEEGIGAYTDVSMSGTLEVERHPPSRPDDPPGGMPFRSLFDGTIEIAG